MNFIKELKNNSLLICPNDIKKIILQELNKLNKLINIKFMTIEELVKKYYFDYDNKTILYLINNYHINYDIAIIYLRNIYYVGDSNYTDSKLNKLKNIKKDLQEHNLLIKDKLFKDFLKNKEIIVYGYDYLVDINNKVIKDISKDYPVRIIDKEYQEYPHVIYEASTMEEEIEFVCKQICEFINKGVDINKIKLSNISSEYNIPLKRIFSMYNIPLYLNDEPSIYSTKVVSDFLELYNSDITITIDKLKELYPNSDIVNKIIDIVNEYYFVDDYEEVKVLIIHDLQRTKIVNKAYTNCVKVIDYNTYIADDEYIFLMNFNQNSIPIIKKDEDYLSNDTKTSLSLEDTYTINRLEKESNIRNIKNIKNLTITYKLKSQTTSYYPSNLVEDLNYQVIKIENDILTSYSTLYNKIKLTKSLDNLIKYGIATKELSILNNNYQIDYLKYDHKYSKIDKSDYYNYINNNLVMSYSTMDNYNKCAFRYYLANVLKIDIYDDTFITFIGSLFHHILEIGLLNDIDVNREIDNYIKDSDRELSNKEKFFVNKISKDIEFVLKTIRKQLNYSNLDKILFEEEIKIVKQEDITITFKGFIDKIMYQERPNEVIVALIDYKTGSADIKLENTIYGLSLQLPVYLYLANHKFKNVKFAGFYLQHILQNEISIDKSKTYNQKKEDNLKLEGYSNSDVNILREFDSNYESSNMIKGMRCKKDGSFYSNTKVLNDDQINKLIDIVEDNIKSNATKISNVEFDINPKQVGYAPDSLVGCKFCKFKDICFMDNKDIVILKEEKDLSFLGGEEDA